MDSHSPIHLLLVCMLCPQPFISYFVCFSFSFWKRCFNVFLMCIPTSILLYGYPDWFFGFSLFIIFFSLLVLPLIPYVCLFCLFFFIHSCVQVSNHSFVYSFIQPFNFFFDELIPFKINSLFAQILEPHVTCGHFPLFFLSWFFHISFFGLPFMIFI